MPQCQFLFCAIFSKKIVLEIFSELDETKPKVPIFPTRTRSPKETRRGPGGWPHHRAARPPLASPRQGLGPWPPTDVALPPIYSVPRENPKYPSLHPRKVPQPPSSSTLVREGSEALPAPCRGGESSPEGSISPCLPPE